MALNQKQRVEEFIDRWRGRGDEKQETQLFWLDLMQNVLGLQHAIESTKFEYKTAGNGFIDVLCPDARFLVEQKSSDIDLDKPEPRQGDYGHANPAGGPLFRQSSVEPEAFQDLRV